MNVLGRITAMPTLPVPLQGLREVAYNLWWSWHPEAQRLFEQLDPGSWKRFRGNPVKQLLETDPDRIAALAEDASYLGQVEAVVESFRKYLSSRPQSTAPLIGYFSMEFGFHESLPIYSGGLGILAGDHIKAASDHGLNLVGVGLFYHQGYFRQELSPDGQQKEVYDEQHPEELPLTPVEDAEGRPLRVGVEFPGRTVWVTAYKAQVGTVPVYLMSTNLPENTPDDRYLTARLYVPGQEMRIQQELILGVGGVRILRALGLSPAVWHMNEGHAAFMGLERIRELVAAGKSFSEALEAAASGALFTTHTPVPAGHDSFPLDLVERYLNGWWDKFGISRDEFMALGLEQKSWGPVFSMSNLALTLSRAANGVSKLHGEVSRHMFRHLWPGLEPEEVPVGHVTNGVHTWTFLHPELLQLYRQHFPPQWRERVEDPALWRTEDLREEDLWRLRNSLRANLVREVRARLLEQRKRNGEAPARLREAEKVLDPNALTIGFARRFATYKRAVLLFTDPERLVRIVRGPYPVQFVFAGKAHPQDDPGKAFIKDLVAKIRELGLEDRMVLLENYDMGLARSLVQGVDIWLNTPRRPMEASGTSGMKAALNGALNFSILDGWWAEAFNTRNGWQIGDERSYATEEAQDTADAQALYYTLEYEILPLFYARGAEGTPSGWLNMVRESIKSVGPRFSAARMVRDYLNQYYLPLAQRSARLNAGEGIKEIAAWKTRLKNQWSNVRLWVENRGDVMVNGQGLNLRAFLSAPNLPEDTLRVELVVRRSSGDLEVLPLKPAGREREALVFEGNYLPHRPGSYVYGVRAIAVHPELSSPHEVAFIKWA
ncbi:MULTISPECIES: alpha-glucan family phosphorylase [unclassified Meiothermus]|uniref:alpha-glucan family phosphorylase n=1 Tax=unclassified Meiothermus TaxID=370471 RepID=UPI000D7C2070|nr:MULTISPECIES: alpha-glucan family phosphorylase [unclassified Meiothermus]PZA06517.1 alpha-glucan phosphorylase [Meiothermus sp. Pnk-1]RYM37192.1 glycosyltransferase family 1 protein [Meiothermus sp. PNK-Is4]